MRSLPLFIINLTLWKQRNSGRLDRRLGSFSSLLTWLICNEMKRKREISQWKKRREITEPHQPQILGGCNGWMLSEEQEGRDKVSEVHAFSSLLLLHFSFNHSSLCFLFSFKLNTRFSSFTCFNWMKRKQRTSEERNGNEGTEARIHFTHLLLCLSLSSFSLSIKHKRKKRSAWLNLKRKGRTTMRWMVLWRRLWREERKWRMTARFSLHIFSHKTIHHPSFPFLSVNFQWSET